MEAYGLTESTAVVTAQIPGDSTPGQFNCPSGFRAQYEWVLLSLFENTYLIIIVNNVFCFVVEQAILFILAMSQV